MDNEKFLKVSAIENGTVIDHIPPAALFSVIRILKLDEVETPITFATNLPSVRLGRKAMIKLTDVTCSDEEVNYLALVAPTARISRIERYEVVDKRQVEPPTQVKGLVRCANPMCITNHERIATRFDVSKSEGQLALRCIYCEKTTYQEQFEVCR